MVDRVEPSPNKRNVIYATSQAIRNAGGSDGWIVPTTESVVASVEGMTGAPLNAFTQSSSATSLSVTIDTGEAFVLGRWIARDTTTSVTLAASTAGQTVYAGWGYGGTNTVIIGLAGAFGPNDGRIPLFDFETDASGVINVTDRRQIGNDSVNSPQGSTVYVQSTPPSDPDENDIWIDTS